MSAAGELQAAIVAALAGADGIVGIASGVYDMPPARALYPYVVLGDGFVTDWSTKTERGREHRVSVIAWDEAGRTARLLGLADAIERTLDSLPPALPSHRIASGILVRSRILRVPGGPWAGQVEWRLRTFSN